MKNTPVKETTISTQTLNFSRRRGRPRNNLPQIDTGTPETVMKRLLGVTTEALDLCLERKIIDKKQHWCGIHLRWLYTLRHGVPSVRATDLSNTNDYNQKSAEFEDPLWRAAREKEYNDAISALSRNGYALSLMNLCIYNERPKFMNLSNNSKENSTNIQEHIEKLREGMNILVSLWKNS